MNPPRSALSPEPVLGKEHRALDQFDQKGSAIRGPERHAKGILAVKGSEPSSARNVVGTGKKPGPASANETRTGADFSARISVIDAADRMAYSDLRDRRGWQQPLTAGQAANEARHRGKHADGAPAPAAEPRIVKTVELTTRATPSTGERGRPVVAEPTPYRAGKLRASSGCSAPAPKLHADASVARTRNR